MPTYDYECEKCGKVEEVFQKGTGVVERRCPECSSPMRRLIGTGCGLIFKGSGFYITDYKNKNSVKNSCASGETPKTCPKKEGTSGGGSCNACGK